MRTATALLLTLSVILLPAAASGATLVVNADVDVTKVNGEQVELIFLGKKTLWDSGERIVPVLINEDSEPSKQFLESILKKSVSQYRAYWKRRLFSGGGAVPKTFRTSDEVVEFVSKTPGAIGVVQSGAKDNRVKVVEVR